METPQDGFEFLATELMRTLPDSEFQRGRLMQQIKYASVKGGFDTQGVAIAYGQESAKTPLKKTPAFSRAQRLAIANVLSAATPEYARGESPHGEREEEWTRFDDMVDGLAKLFEPNESRLFRAMCKRKFG